MEFPSDFKELQEYYDEAKMIGIISIIVLLAIACIALLFLLRH